MNPKRAALVEGHPFLRRLATYLAHNPGARAADDGNPGRAAVAVLFRPTPGPGDDLDLLLIERAERAGDPWSGHVAFPGGRQDPSDLSLEATAERETLEETSIDIGRDGVLFGTLDELRPRSPSLPPIIVTPFVGVVRGDVSISMSAELADAFWVPWSTLGDPATSRESVVRVRGSEWRVPSFVLGRRIVWGMTDRILRELQAVSLRPDGA